MKDKETDSQKRTVTAECPCGRVREITEPNDGSKTLKYTCGCGEIVTVKFHKNMVNAFAKGSSPNPCRVLKVEGRGN
jgi:hypothetical protein